jgi:alkanesulfonate monooxygenase SsuD/methylene tetrahydromethanopterin reductase-like flavin-dependent oxidoreductase (luciferase family)
LIIGAGLGWAKEEFEVLGVPFERRGARFEECVRVMRALWTGEYVDFDGEFYHLDGWTSRPVPPRRIPILVGGHGPIQMRRIGQIADGWLTHGNSVPTLKQDFEPARQAAIEAGRNPDELTIAMTGIGLLEKDALEDAAERLQRAKEAGVHHATIGIHPREMESAPDLIEAFAAKYLKDLQAD